MPHFDGRLVIATHNEGKLREYTNMLSPYADDIISAGDLGLPEPEETGASFTENAIIKACAAALASGHAALADDSGLCVTALGGQPGLYSARWAQTEKSVKPGKNFPAAMQRIHNELGDSPDRSAHFICALVLARPDGTVDVVEGRIDGHIAWPPRGDKGHGYDPIFVPQGHTRTFAEMNDQDKNVISHRAMAISKMVRILETKTAR